MGIILANVVPISIDDQGTLPANWGPFQSIELHDYQSLPGASYLSPAHRTFSIVSGLPPGLSVAAADGVVSGTVGSCTSDQALIDAITAFDDPIQLASFITESCTVTPSSYVLGDVVEIIYKFPAVTIMGIWDMPVGVGTVPITVTKVFEINIIKNFANDISAYDSLPD